jgi:hypothetical protein
MNTTLQPFSFLAGKEVLGMASEGWQFDHGQGPDHGREYKLRVHFTTAFRNTPLVHLGLSGFDISNHDAARLSASAANISAEGFDLVLATWLDTRIWRVEVNWLAIGA